MFRLHLWTLVVLLGGACTTAGGRGDSTGAGGFPAENSGGADGTAAGGTGGRAGTLRIMPLGDSITAATCWRAMLWQQLSSSERAGQFDLVGSRKSNSDARGGCTPSNADADNEGHSSCLITEIINDVDASSTRGCDTRISTLKPLLTADEADVVLMHFGTNDVWNGISSTRILAAYSAMVDELRAVNPNVMILVAQIIPMNVTSTTCSGCACPSCPADVVTLNTAITDWAHSESTLASPITVVDQHTGFDALADTVDGVHPNASGSTKMSMKWFQALTAIF